MVNPTEFLLSLRGFILAIDKNNAPPGQLGHEELAAGNGLVSAIDPLVNAKVQEGMKAIQDAQRRRPQKS